MAKTVEKKRPPVWMMVREAMASISGEATYKDIKQHIMKKYKDVNERTIQAQIVICSVNQKSRVHYPPNRKPRICDDKYDFLYCLGNGRVALYDPMVHGQWGIVEEKGKLEVLKMQPQIESAPKQSDQSANMLAPFSQWREVLSNNLGLFGQGLQLYLEPSGRTGLEYPTEMGMVDILAVDEKNTLVIIQMADEVLPENLTRILACMGWARKKMAAGEVRGILLTGKVDEKLPLIIDEISSLELYQVQFSLVINKLSTTV
ncbi:MAG: hypothetical protein ACM3MK_06375 [Chitinophagales bacterium]